MSTWPQGIVTPQGADDLLAGIDPNIWLTSDDGSKKFYVMGGLAPFPGVQAGVICTSHPSGMSAPFKHQDTQGARQDGVTYQGTVFDPTKITFELDIHARDAATLSLIRAEWEGMWHPRKQVLCEYITPDGGYWRGLLRLMPDSFGNKFKLTPRRLGVWSMTVNARIDTTFWETISVQGTWAPKFEAFSDAFTTPTTSGLSRDWLSISSAGHTGHVYVGADAEVHWQDTANTAQSVINVYTAATTTTDNQVVTVTVGTNWQNVQLFGQGTIIIGCRLDAKGNGVFCEIAWNVLNVYSVSGGIVSQPIYQNLLLTPVCPGETWQFVAGAAANVPRSYAVFRNGLEVAVFAEHGTSSPLGEGNRFTGFGMTTEAGVFGESRPVPVGYFAGGDNAAVTASGTIDLSNQGTEDAYPYILFYGPGTWGFGDGPSSTNMITVGPLIDGQILFLSTLPRQQKVIDMSPANMQPNPDAQAAVQAQITKMFGGNMPVLAEDYASLFGIIPAQGNLQGLVSGLFDTPIPGVDTPQDVVTSHMPVSITGGTATSKIIMAVTPRRIHPA